jgi:hypothetical protein
VNDKYGRGTLTTAAEGAKTMEDGKIISSKTTQLIG